MSLLRQLLLSLLLTILPPKLESQSKLSTENTQANVIERKLNKHKVG